MKSGSHSRASVRCIFIMREVAERIAQARRAKGVQHAKGRNPGVACRASLADQNDCGSELILKLSHPMVNNSAFPLQTKHYLRDRLLGACKLQIDVGTARL